MLSPPVESPTQPALRRPPWWSRPVIAVGIPICVAIIHAIVVGRHYFVGSFDDDASYILGAKALVAGQGLTGHLTSGATVVGAYPPGFSVLLAPLVALWPHSYVPLRVFAAVATTVLLPLTWYYLGRRRCPDPVRVTVMVLLALNVVLATYATMVMAEAPTLVALIGLLLLVERWDLSAKVFSPAGIGAIVTAAGLIWLKEATLGMTVGLILWLLFHRRFRRAITTAVGVGVLLLPVVVARLIAGGALAGSRYSEELGGYYSGGLVGRLFHVLPTGFGHFFSTALPNTLVPLGSPIPYGGTWTNVTNVVMWQVALFTLIGFAVWVVRHRDASVLVVTVYLAETLLWPYINERRVVLALPVLVAWYALGLWTSARWLVVRARDRHLQPRLVGTAFAALAAVVVLAPLVVQFNRDYLFANNQTSSQPLGSRYAAILSHVGSPHTVVETDYLSTTALISGHRTANSAFLAVNGAIIEDPIHCSTALITRGIAADDAGYLLIGALNHPDVLDSRCILDMATTQPWAVRLLRTARDEASVFELIGPGTAHPDLSDVTRGAVETASGPLAPPATSPGDDTSATTISDGQATLTWTWPRAATIHQVSVGEAGSSGGTRAVHVELRSPDGQWTPVASAPGAVGDRPAAAPYLLATPPGTTATAMRVVITGSGQASVTDVHALATRSGSTS